MSSQPFASQPDDSIADLSGEIVPLAWVPPDDWGTLQVLVETDLPPHEHPAMVYLASLAPGSRRAMRGALNTVAALLTGGRYDAWNLPWGELRFSHTQAVRAALAERYAPAMANKCLAAMRGTLKAAWRLNQIPTEEFQRAIDIQAVRGTTLPRGRALTTGELRALLGICLHENTLIGARDVAVLALLYNCGLRREEAVSLDCADYDEQTGEIRVRSGKGRKARTV